MAEPQLESSGDKENSAEPTLVPKRTKSTYESSKITNPPTSPTKDNTESYLVDMTEEGLGTSFILTGMSKPSEK
jgi:hypothetical protein